MEVYSHTKSADPVTDPSSSGSSKVNDKKAKEVIEPTYDPPVPFQNRLRSKKNTTQMEKILEIFKQVKVNIPLLEVVEQIPSYAKFLKDLCTKKRAHQTPRRSSSLQISARS